MKLYRELTEKVKTCTIKREARLWYAIFACEVEAELVYHPSEEIVGKEIVGN